MAIKHGLLLAHAQGFSKIICHSDSKTAIDLVKSGVDFFHLYASLVGDIRTILSSGWEVCVEHSLHEANFSADWLAKEGAQDPVAFKT